MKEKICLNGMWKLYYYESETVQINNPSQLHNLIPIDAKVPGNVEISLAEAGIIEKELFKGMATAENQKFEEYEWWYEKKFRLDKKINNEKITLRFKAVDCFADYYLNGEKIGNSENAFIPVEFDVTDIIKENEINILYVHIKPAIWYALKQNYNQYLSACYIGHQTFVRKPAHSFGWDIFPRTVSAGIWKDAELIIDDGYSFEEFSYCVETANKDKAVVAFYSILNIPYKEYKKNISVRIMGKCRDSSFTAVNDMKHFKAGHIKTKIENPYLWWPYGYGDANIYELVYELLIDGKVYDTGILSMGIRTVVLERTETMLVKDHCFRFIINGVNVMCRGSNWVPLNAYHSLDKERYQKALDLFCDTHCNILRVWGGGVYEQAEFYDYCDTHGIMVWQDFMMACFNISTDENTMKNIEQEAKWAVKNLRHHPSIILWSGDNEIDEVSANRDLRPGMNKINRELLAEIIEKNDMSRPYLSSSPYISDEVYHEYTKGNDIFPERHLWGSRDYFKADFYKNSKAHFVSETGYHGCPCYESIEKTVDKEYIWPIFNEQWSLHSSDQNGSMQRVQLMADQIRQLFGFMPDNINDFIFASQISQAEAKKYFIERVRIKKPYTSGIVWWNMLDGWPQMSDAVVDYFFEKKPAYFYIKNSQQPFALMIDEMKDWHYTLVAANDTLEEKKGDI